MATARVASILDERPELTELHSHVGGAVDPAIMWSIAHQAGIRLPTKDYWQFVELISVSHPDKVNNLAEYDLIFRWTEKIQSSPDGHRALGLRDHRQGVSLAARRHADRAALQSDEAQPGRRARPRPHHLTRRFAGWTARCLEYRRRAPVSS